MKKSGIKQIHGLGTIKNIKDLRDKVNRAKNNPTELTNLLCKDFNIRQNDQDRQVTFDIANNEETYIRKNLEIKPERPKNKNKNIPKKRPSFQELIRLNSKNTGFYNKGCYLLSFYNQNFKGNRFY